MQCRPEKPAVVFERFVGRASGEGVKGWNCRRGFGNQESHRRASSAKDLGFIHFKSLKDQEAECKSSNCVSSGPQEVGA